MEKKISLSEAVRTALSEEMRRDPDVFMIGEDIGRFGGCFGVTAGMWDEFKDRIYETPICEMAPAQACIGAAALGMRPVMEVMFGDFIGFCYSPILVEAPQHHFLTNGAINMPITFRMAVGGFISSGAHHSNCIEGWINNHPGIKVVAPSTPKDAYGLLKSSIRENNPVIFMECKVQYGHTGDVPVDEDFTIPLGKADVVQEGKDVTIVAWQLMRDFACAAAPALEEAGISAEIIDPRTLIPFDYETVLASVKKTGRLLIVHEHVKEGGMGESIAANVMKEAWNDLKKPVSVLGRKSFPIPAGAVEAAIYPSTDSIIEEVKELMK